MKLYLASPLGFSEIGRSFYTDQILSPLKALGYDLLDPWSLTDATKIEAISALPPGPTRRDAWQSINREIGQNNKEAIDQANAVFAVLDGVDVDSGTASEIGYAFARNKLIIGYRGDFRLSADNEGAIINLQVQYFIEASGGTIIRNICDLPEALAQIVPQPK